MGPVGIVCKKETVVRETTVGSYSPRQHFTKGNLSLARGRGAERSLLRVSVPPGARAACMSPGMLLNTPQSPGPTPEGSPPRKSAVPRERPWPGVWGGAARSRGPWCAVVGPRTAGLPAWAQDADMLTHTCTQARGSPCRERGRGCPVMAREASTSGHTCCPSATLRPAWPRALGSSEPSVCVWGGGETRPRAQGRASRYWSEQRGSTLLRNSTKPSREVVVMVKAAWTPGS